ncbi:MAG: DUF4221 family protein [Bacteroidia bacterium]
MNNWFKLILLVIFACILQNCRFFPKSKSGQLGYNIVQENIINTTLPEHHIKLNYHIDDDNKFLTWLNQYPLSINILNIEHSDSIISIAVDNISHISYFIKGKDSVVILKTWQGSNFLIILDMLGDTIAHHEILIENNQGKSFSTSEPFSLHNNILYAFVGQYVRNPNSSEHIKNFYSAPHQLRVPLSDDYQLRGKVEGGTFPQMYQEDNHFPNPYISQIIMGDTIYYSFGSCDDIQMEVKGSRGMNIPASSNYLKEFTPYPREKLRDYAFARKYNIQEGRYYRIYYDKHKNYFYRVVFHGAKYANDDGTLNDMYDKPWSIITLDGNLKRVKETLMDNVRYYPYIAGITKEGLIIRRLVNDPNLFQCDLLTINY